MDLELMKAAVVLEGVLSGTSALELFAEVESLTALCDEYRGEVEDRTAEARRQVSLTEELFFAATGSRTPQEGLLADVRAALTRARAEGMVEAARIAERATTHFRVQDVTVRDIAAAIRARAEACRLAEQANKGE